jgi:hypothetical protein
LNPDLALIAGGDIAIRARLRSHIQDRTMTITGFRITIIRGRTMIRDRITIGLIMSTTIVRTMIALNMSTTIVRTMTVATEDTVHSKSDGPFGALFSSLNFPSSTFTFFHPDFVH